MERTKTETSEWWRVHVVNGEVTSFVVNAINVAAAQKKVDNYCIENPQLGIVVEPPIDPGLAVEALSQEEQAYYDTIGIFNGPVRLEKFMYHPDDVIPRVPRVTHDRDQKSLF
jgi:hypothetical protein